MVISAGGPENKCSTHGSHDSRLVTVVPSSHPVWDYPRCLTSLDQMFVFDAPQYFNTPGYCSGDDEVSRSIIANGVWEGYETALIHALTASGGSLVDIGSHIGWFSLVAALNGCDVHAFDADAENLQLLSKTAELLGVADRIEVIRGWIGPDTPPATPCDITVLKMDIEGAEPDALRIFDQHFKDRRVENAIIEVTPKWSPHIIEALATIRGYGYQWHVLPSKGHLVEEFSTDPITAAKTLPDSFDVEQVNVWMRRV